ncbi:carbamoyltransferase N-terminal domain-containing protein [Kalamiella sp. sgz302252]|uniref:carbamoyltransferase N-terminal domain-containing protein n=1 Tax=Pantoea sp. sgz302252 TaxID=3341827 RepID=UPI0036D2DA2A
MKNGNIIAAVHEERFTRIKAHKVWPQQSIDYVLHFAGKTLKDIDTIAYGWKAGFNEDYCLNLYVERIINECVNNSHNIDILKTELQMS